MADGNRDRIGAALTGHERRKTERQASEATARERGRREQQVTTERWLDLREAVVRPCLMEASGKINRVGHNVEILNHGDSGLKFDVTPQGHSYTCSLTIAPNSENGNIMVVASLGRVGTKGIPQEHLTPEMFRDLLDEFVEDVFGDEQRPSRNW